MRIVSFLLFYYPFHEFLLKLTGLTGPSLFLLRQWPDVAIFFMFVIVVLARASQRRLNFSRHGIFQWLAMFLIWGIVISVSTKGNSLGVAFSELFVLLRFTLLFGIIMLLAPSEMQTQRVFRLLIISVTIQALIGWVQVFGGAAVIDFFKPSDYASIVADVERSFTSNREGASRVIIGTTGDFISLAYLLAIGLFVTAVSGMLKIRKIFLVVSGLILLFLCGSRTIFLGTVATFAIFGLMMQRIDKKVAYGVLLLVAVIPIVTFLHSLAGRQTFDYSSYLSIFDSRILESLINQRLGIAIFVVPEYIWSGDFLFGLSPDRFYIAHYVGLYYDHVPSSLVAVLPEVVEDIYPLALFLYYGAPGVLLLAATFRGLWGRSKKVLKNVDARLGSLGIMALIALAIFIFGNQALENRMFAFHFWLIMGLVCNSLASRTKLYAHSSSP